VSTAVRRRCPPELARGRFRIVVFVLVLIASAALGNTLACLAALAGVALGVWSLSVTRRRGSALAHTFASCDWIVLGLCLAASGGTRSLLLAAVPLLVLTQLLPSAHREWPYLIAPVLLAAIVMAIVDPTLGGHRVLGLLAVAALVTLGVLVAQRLRAPAPRAQRQTVDPATGFYCASRALPLLTRELDRAIHHHDALSVVCVRVDHFRDVHHFLGEQGVETIAGTVARRLKRHLEPDDVAFRVRSDTFLFVLNGRGLRDARACAAAMRHDVSAELVEHRRVTVTTGSAAFPPLRTVDDLIDEAFTGLTRDETLALAVAQ
jgi:diguanylate cyclase (GGDEF)-like protein